MVQIGLCRGTIPRRTPRLPAPLLTPPKPGHRASPPDSRLTVSGQPTSGMVFPRTRKVRHPRAPRLRRRPEEVTRLPRRYHRGGGFAEAVLAGAVFPRRCYRGGSDPAREMAVSDEFDVIVLGGGPGGYAAALRAAQLDLSVGLVEKDKIGGTCLHRGCIPTKALLHAAEVADATRESAQFGIKADFGGVDMAAVNSYKDGVVTKGYRGLQGLIKAAKKITVVEGEGRLTARDTVEVTPVGSNAGQRLLTGRHVVLATGSYSRTLPGLNIDGERIITSEHALTLDRVPASVVVLGGGVIGCEFASVWRSFGAEVTI